MESSTINQTQAMQIAIAQKMLELQNRIKGGVGWFFWIAGLSIINSIIYMMGSTTTFIIGLAVTQIIDRLAIGIGNEVPEMATAMRIICIVLDVIIAGVFVACGIFGIKRIRWVVIVGLVLYSLDALIFLAFGGWLPFLFHLFALWGLWRGMMAIKEIKALEASQSTGDLDTIQKLMAVPHPSVSQKPSTFFRNFVFITIGLLVIALIIVVVFVLLSN